MNVIFWIHGFYVSGAKNLFNPEKLYETKLRESVRDSEMNVVLIAPWLGYRNLQGGSIGAGKLGEGKGCEHYLKEVLTELGPLIGGTQDIVIDTLIIACHSAGGWIMWDIVKTLGDYRTNLKECWGFDCIYHPAKTWGEWIRKNKANTTLFFYIANGSKSQYAVDLIKTVNGTLQKPTSDASRQNVFLTPALKAPGTLFDRIAFQTAEEIQKKSAGDAYEMIRKDVDPLLDKRSGEYWVKIRPKLKGHFEVVIDLLAPRIRHIGKPPALQRFLHNFLGWD